MTFQEGDIQRDINILEVIVIKIKKYFDKKLSIGSLISNLENLLNQLTTVNENWKEDFRTLWSNIEVVYALALDQGLEKLTNEDNTIVESSLHDLKKMTEDKITVITTGK